VARLDKLPGRGDGPILIIGYYIFVADLVLQVGVGREDAFLGTDVNVQVCHIPQLYHKEMLKGGFIV